MSDPRLHFSGSSDESWGQALERVLTPRGFQLKSRLASGYLFADSELADFVIVDLKICQHAALQYIDYTREQNQLMFRSKRLFRVSVEKPEEIDQIGTEVDYFRQDGGDTEIPESLRSGRDQTHPDPTKPERAFEELFSLAFGDSALFALTRETGFTDFEGTTRFVDYKLETADGLIAIELNGESFHHPRCIGVDRYRSQLIKQNSLVASGWKVYRWSLRGMQDRERFVDEMRRFFGSAKRFHATPRCFVARNFVQLKAHQETAVKRLQEERSNGKRAFLLVLPTGTGKTEIFIEDFRRLKEMCPNLNGLLLVPTRNLRDQMLARLAERLATLEHGLGYQIARPKAGFMVQTYAHMVRHADQFRPDAFGYIVIDEAHHALAPGLKRAIEHFQPQSLIGATATDRRLDSKRLEEIFGEYQSDLSLEEAIQRGLLPPIRAFRIQSNLDLSEVRYNGMDYVQSDLQRTLLVQSRDELVAQVLRRHFETGRMAEKQGVVFCVNVRHAKAMAALLNRYGLRAAAVSGGDRERSDTATASYFAGRIRFLCACDLLTEGWDSPQTSILVMARPTMSKVLYVQQLGRGTRHYPGKEALYVLDVVDQYGPLNAPWSVHALFGLNQYQPWATVVGEAQPHEHSDEIVTLDGLYEEERRVTEINIFTFQKQWEDHLNEEQLARELFVSTGTIKNWIKKGEIKPDVEVPFGSSVLRYFAPSRVAEIRTNKNLTVHDASTQYTDFFEFLEERDYTFSYKMIFILGVLTLQNNRGEIMLDELASVYRGFYQDRLRQQLPADRKKSPYNAADYLSSETEIKKSILANPFEKFERKRFMHYCKDLAYIAWDSDLFAKIIERNDAGRVFRQMATDLKKYYADLNGLGDSSYLAKAFPGIAVYLEAEQGETRDIIPIETFVQELAYTECLPFYPLDVAAGAFLYGETPEPEGWINVRRAGYHRPIGEDMFVTRPVGRSMEPTISDGSFCIFRKGVGGTRQGRILLVKKLGFSDPETGANYTIKRYFSTKAPTDDGWEHTTIDLVPDNPDRVTYPILKFTKADDADLVVLAEFVGVLSLGQPPST